MSPMAPPKPCAHPMCPELVPTKQTYCQAHQRQRWREQNERKGKWRKFYGSARWRKVRKIVLASHPTCQVCKRREAREVHHVKPLREHPELAYDLENLVACCSHCHRSHEARKQRLWE